MRKGDLLKSSSPTIHSGELVLEGYTKDTDMCILNVLTTYLEHKVVERFWDKIVYCISKTSS